MFSSLLTTKERIIYSALPDGLTNSIAIKNVTLDKAPVTIHRALHTLLSEKALTESCYKYRDPLFNRPRDLRFYRLTAKGIDMYFPFLAAHAPAVSAFLASAHDVSKMTVVAAANANRRERTLRVQECEMFCSAAGILTSLDKRSAHSSSVFGGKSDSQNCEAVLHSCETASLSSSASLSFRDRLCEAAKLGTSDVKWNDLLSAALCPSDPYSFYRAGEIVTTPKAGQSSGNKDIAVIRSQYIGAVVNQTRGFVLYRAPRYNGMDWIPRMETRVQMGVSNFCRRYIPNCKISSLSPVQNAIFFYRTDREIENILAKARKLSELGLPFQSIYAIPFSQEGLRIFRSILVSPTFEQDCIKRVCEADPSFAPTKGASLYRLSYFGSIPCLSAFPLELRRMSRVLNIKESASFSVAGFPWQREIFTKVLPDAAFLEMDI